MIFQGLRGALHTSNQPNLALVDNTLTNYQRVLGEKRRATPPGRGSPSFFPKTSLLGRYSSSEIRSPLTKVLDDLMNDPRLTSKQKQAAEQVVEVFVAWLRNQLAQNKIKV